jgi:glutamate:GABA antiporter
VGNSDPGLRRTLGTLDLVLLNATAIVSFRWLSIAAHLGPAGLTLWVLGMVTFFVPSALTVLELNSRLPGEGGLYIWSKAAFGEFNAFIVGWSYWISNLFFLPSVALFVAGVALYIGSPSALKYAESPLYNATVCLGILWFATVLNIVGLNYAKWLNNLGGVATWLAGATIVGGGVLAWYRFGSATPLKAPAFMPSFASLDTWSAFSAMALAYVGLELGPIMAGEAKDPRRSISRGILFSCLVVPVVYVLGTAALLVALPAGQISFISGIPQALAAVGSRLGVGAFGSLAAALVMLSQVGTLAAWVTGTARLPFMFGLDRYLPKALGATHPRFGSPYVAILVQSILTTVMLFAAISGSAVHEAFLVLIDMSIILTLVPLAYMFAALPVLRMRSKLADADVVRVPGGLFGCWVVAGLGVATTLLGAFVAMIPPTSSASRTLVALKVIGGSILLMAVGLGFYFTGRRRSSHIAATHRGTRLAAARADPSRRKDE